MAILTEYLRMGPDAVGGTPTPPPSPPRTTPPDAEGAPTPSGTVDGHVDTAEGGEIIAEEMAAYTESMGGDIGNLALENPQQASLLLQIRTVVAQQKIAEGDVHRGVADSADQHHEATTNAQAEGDVLHREVDARSDFRSDVRAALATGDTNELQSLWERQFGKGSLSGEKANQTKDAAAHDGSRPPIPTPGKGGTSPVPTGTGTPTGTPTALPRNTLNMSQLTQPQRDLVNRFTTLRNEARSLRDHANTVPPPANRDDLLAQAELRSMEGDAIQAQLADQGINLDENTEIREEGEEGASSGDAEGSGGVAGLDDAHVVHDAHGTGEGSGGEGGSGDGAALADQPADVSFIEGLEAACPQISSEGESSTVHGMRVSSYGVRALEGGMAYTVTADSRHVVGGLGGRRGRGGGSGSGGRGEENPLAFAPLGGRREGGPDVRRGTVDGGLGGSSVAVVDGRVYSMWEVRAASSPDGERTPRIDRLIALEEANPGILGDMTHGTDDYSGGRSVAANSAGTFGGGLGLDNLYFTARRLYDPRAAESGGYHHGMFA